MARQYARNWLRYLPEDYKTDTTPLPTAQELHSKAGQVYIELYRRAIEHPSELLPCLQALAVQGDLGFLNSLRGATQNNNPKRSMMVAFDRIGTVRSSGYKRLKELGLTSADVQMGTPDELVAKSPRLAAGARMVMDLHNQLQAAIETYQRPHEAHPLPSLLETLQSRQVANDVQPQPPPVDPLLVQARMKELEAEHAAQDALLRANPLLSTTIEVGPRSK